MTKFYLAGHALICKDDEYLVMRRSTKNDYMPLKWDLPGGTIEAGETVEQGLLREVKEETGLEIRVGRALYIYTNLSQLPDRQTFQSVYLCNYVLGEVKTDPLEHDDHAWLDREQLRQVDAIGFLKAFTVSGAFDQKLS